MQLRVVTTYILVVKYLKGLSGTIANMYKTQLNFEVLC